VLPRVSRSSEFRFIFSSYSYCVLTFFPFFQRFGVFPSDADRPDALLTFFFIVVPPTFPFAPGFRLPNFNTFDLPHPIGPFLYMTAGPQDELLGFSHPSFPNFFGLFSAPFVPFVLRLYGKIFPAPNLNSIPLSHLAASIFLQSPPWFSSESVYGIFFVLFLTPSNCSSFSPRLLTLSVTLTGFFLLLFSAFFVRRDFPFLLQAIQRMRVFG